MHINFNKVEIQNFRSIKKANIQLSNQGIVLIRGINLYEEKSESNGSGKSSIFESIIWCLYGKTSGGVSDVRNRYSSDGCLVKLYIEIDGSQYTIIRSIKHKEYKTGVVIIAGDKDISGRNKSDSDKIIRYDILGVSSDIFLSIMFLSQGFYNRLGKLTPSGRKERIETLTDTSEKIEEFKSRASALATKYNNEYTAFLRESSEKSGAMSVIERNIEELRQELSDKANIKDIDNMEQLILSKAKFEMAIQNASTEHKERYESYHKCLSEYQNSKTILSEANRQLSSLQEEIIKLSGSKICPACLRPLDEESQAQITQIIEEKELEVSKLNKVIDGLSNKMKNQKEDLEALDESVKAKENALDKLRKRLDKIVSEIIEASGKSSLDTEEIKSKISDLQDKYNIFKRDKNEIDNKKEIASENIEVTKHIVTLISKQFRGYLLKTVIDYMNTSLQRYSEMLFSGEQDVIHLDIDASKLDIYLGDSLYDSLSGGEQRKVDIALTFVQRDLALEVAGLSSNILVLDEIFDGLDRESFMCVMDMVNSVSETTDSIFIISHRPSDEVARDSTIIVTKGKDRQSIISQD